MLTKKDAKQSETIILKIIKTFSHVSIWTSTTHHQNKQQINNFQIQDRDLEVLLFQFGRYLIIGSSRDKIILPANLQGIWNDKITDAPWSSDYHININLQMNYWPTYVANLHECTVEMLLKEVYS